MNKISFLLLSAFVFCAVSCTSNKAKINNDLKKYFDSAQVDGAFTLLNNQAGSITVYNMKLDTQRVLPGSSFDIVNSLIGVQTGKITDENMVIKWDGQLGLMSRLYFDQLPFQKYAQQMVRDAMAMEDNTLYKFSYKAGRGFDEKNNEIGWVTGWIEENMHVYFFVTLMKSPGKNIDMKAVGVNITRGILKELGFFKGQM